MRLKANFEACATNLYLVLTGYFNYDKNQLPENGEVTINSGILIVFLNAKPSIQQVFIWQKK
jgi:hypothetical protein